MNYDYPNLYPIEHVVFNKNYNSVALAYENEINFYYQKKVV